MIMRTDRQAKGSGAQRHRGLIDRSHLARQTLGDRGLEAEVLRLYDVMARTYFERIELSTDRDQLAANMQALRMASAGVGAFGIAERAAQAEAAIAEGAPIDPEWVEDLNMAVTEVSTLIRALLAEFDE